MVLGLLNPLGVTAGAINYARKRKQGDASFMRDALPSLLGGPIKGLLVSKGIEMYQERNKKQKQQVVHQGDWKKPVDQEFWQKYAILRTTHPGLPSKKKLRNTIPGTFGDDEGNERDQGIDSSTLSPKAIEEANQLLTEHSENAYEAKVKQLGDAYQPPDDSNVFPADLERLHHLNLQPKIATRPHPVE